MQRLRGSDAFAIYSETSTSPFVTFKVAIYESTDPSRPPDIDELERFVTESFSILGLKRAGLRIIKVPLGLHHPVWVADPEFSPKDHVYRVNLPAPGDKATLCDFLSDLAGMPLNPDRPLWEIWLLGGLEHNRIAAVLKIHHALADGKTVAAMIVRSHSEGVPEARKHERVEGEPIPGKVRLTFDALVDLLKSYTVELPHYYKHLKQAREGSAALEEMAGGHNAQSDSEDRASEIELVKPFSAPWTILNQPGGRYRLYRYETFSLSEFKKLCRIFDCTVNTMVLAICSEALKRYLGELGELPEASMVTAMPVGDQAGSSPKELFGSGIHNNNLAVAMVPLFQNIDDFGARVTAIKNASRRAIDTVKRTNGRRFDNYLDFLPGTFIRMINDWTTRRSNRRESPNANLVISNVPGPRETLYAADGRLKLVELFSTGNLVDAGNLNITVWSYVDRLTFSFYLRKDVLPAPESIPAHVREIVQELQQRHLVDDSAAEDRDPLQARTTSAVADALDN